MLAIRYGYKVEGHNDQKIKAARRLAQLISKTALLGALLINDLPFCEYSLLHQASQALIHSSMIHP
jgi:hypothetical protein